MKRALCILSFALLWTACGADESAMQGSWQAVRFYENGQSVQIALDDVKMYFNTGTKPYYTFQTLGQYYEAGPWRCSGKYLILTDTTSASAPTEKTLKVLYQSTDSLKIKMLSGGKEQVIFFGRAH